MRHLPKLALIAAATATLHGSGFTDIHPSAYPANSTWANGVSADGLVSVGQSDVGGGVKAFKIVGGAYTQLGNLYVGVGAGSWAYAASSDGSSIVGVSMDVSGNEQAVSWSGLTPTLLDSGAHFLSSRATGVSASGAVTIGYGFDATVTYLDQAFYRQGGALHIIAPITAGYANRATGVSANGNLVVGTEANDFNSPLASSGFVYDISANTKTAVGNTAGAGYVFTQLTGISGDGSTVIGTASTALAGAGDEVAFRFVRGSATFTNLGTLGGAWAIPRALSNDGSVIVGQSADGAGRSEAFKYQSGTMTGLGFLGTGDESDATGVSADGTVIVGYSRLTPGGAARHAFVYANQTMLDADAWLRSLNGPGSVLAMAGNLSSQPLEGAHHRPLMSYDGMGKQDQAWATGDFGTSSRQSESHLTSGEIGVSHATGDFVFGLAAGYASLNQDLLFGGSAAIAGNTLLAEADYRLPDKESIASIVLMYGDYAADTSRGYDTGSGLDHSNGHTHVKTSSIRLRFDGPAQKLISPVVVSPFASFTLTRTTADAYAESGGSFPASFAEQTRTAQEGRLGLTAKHVVSPATTLLFTAEWIHRFDGAGAGLTATNSTMGTLTAAGIAPTADQARLGFDVDHRLTADTLLNLSLHAAGVGASADFSAALSLRKAF